MAGSARDPHVPSRADRCGATSASQAQLVPPGADVVLLTRLDPALTRNTGAPCNVGNGLRSRGSQVQILPGASF